MAQKPFQTIKPTHGTRLAMTQGPVQPVKPTPPQADPTIRAMISEAQDGETAAADDASPTPPTSNGALGAYRSALVAPDGFHVP